MTPFVGEFSLSRLERVISGPGTVNRLADELDRRGCAAALVVTGRTLSRSPRLTRVIDGLGSRSAGVFPHTEQHVPASTVDALVTMIRDTRADCLISIGGGSPIDAAKAAVHALLGGSDGPGLPYGSATAALPHIAVPTTLSAGEFTAIAGITDDRSRIKRAVADARLAPCVVITDPELTADTPDWLWTSSGIRALDHAIESIYSIRHHPLSDALAAKAIAALVAHVPGSVRCDDPARLAHRGHCQVAAWLSVFGIANSGFGLSHAFGHQIGPRWNVPHGYTSCVMLPHAMRFMASVAPERFGPIAEGLAVPFDASAPQAAAFACADRVAGVISGLGLPTRLRDVGVPAEDVAQIAGVVHEAMERAQVVGRPLQRTEIAALLGAAH